MNKQLLVLILFIPLLMSCETLKTKNDSIFVPLVQNHSPEPIPPGPNNLPFKLGSFIHDQPAGIIAEVAGLGPNCKTISVLHTLGREVHGSYNSFATIRNLLLKEFQKNNFNASNIEFDYLLEPRMVDIKSKVCYRDSPGGVKGSSYVRFKWILKDQIKNTKIFEVETEGSFVTEQYLPSTPEKGSTELARNAIINATRNLMSDKDFRLIMTSNSVDKTETDKKYVSSDDLDNKKLLPASSGSGFAISKDGYILTNNHVISGCQALNIHINGKLIPARLISSDPTNDLALVKGNFKPQTVFYINPGSPKLLDEVIVAGYPFGYAISSSIKMTTGSVSSLSGIGDNFSNMQIDAAIQPGNSGGPVLDKKGNVIGIAVSKLDVQAVFEDFGVIPENTNFAIKSSTAKSFVESNNISLIKKSTYKGEGLDSFIENGTYYLSCMMTMAKIKELQTQKVFFKNITK